MSTSTTSNLNKLESLDTVESGRALRRALRDAFPGVKFSVRMSRGTGWGTYHVSWTDGPSSDSVREVTGRFEGKGFDGSDDSTYYMDKAIEWKGRTWLSGCGMILESRSNSEETLEAATAQLVEEGFYGPHMDMCCAARMVANGESVLMAASYHGLSR